MKTILISLSMIWLAALTCPAGVTVDDQAFGERLGGWRKKDAKAAEYPLSGATYRTYKPEVSPTPDGGIFVSVRIDHVRGWLSSNDHATLEMTINAIGMIASAQSNIAIQGHSISSDLILGGNEASKELGPSERAVQIGTDLVANLSSKMLREKIVEAGRVSFPAALRHNYNLLYQAIRLNGKPVEIGAPPVAKPVEPLGGAKPEAPATDSEKKDGGEKKADAPEKPVQENATLEIKSYETPGSGSLPTGE